MAKWLMLLKELRKELDEQQATAWETNWIN